MKIIDYDPARIQDLPADSTMFVDIHHITDLCGILRSCFDNGHQVLAIIPDWHEYELAAIGEDFPVKSCDSVFVGAPTKYPVGKRIADVYHFTDAGSQPSEGGGVEV